MKAYMYIVKTDGCWQARMTIEPEVDKWFWLSGNFGEGGVLNESLAAVGWIWREAMPLGDACRAVEHWSGGEEKE